MSSIALPDRLPISASPNRVRLAGGLAVLALALAGMTLLSVVVGARPVSLDAVWTALTAFDPDRVDHRVVAELRLPRTLLGLAVGAALGLAGAVLQGATRNPIASPEIMGLDAGAAAFVVGGIHLFGLSVLSQYVWCALLGAALTTLFVHGVAATGREGATPVKLALAGAAATAALMSVVHALLLAGPHTLDQIRFWSVGALAGRDAALLVQVAPFLAAGMALALALGRSLDGLALGEDTARALGQHVALSRALAGLAAVLLAGSATAAAGPIAFVGLAVPHVARAVTGPGYRWILPYAMVIAPLLLLAADIAGRVVAAPGELPVGVVTVALGAPFFIALVRRRTPAGL